jgi:hypothetical protein
MLYRSMTAPIAFLAHITFREEVSPEHIPDQLDDHDAGLPDAPVSHHLLDVRQCPLSSPLQTSDHPYHPVRATHEFAVAIAYKRTVGIAG